MNSKPDRQFTHNIFAAFPVTFLIVALAYPFLGFHPDMPVLFPMLAYFWHTLFVLLGAVFAAVFKKYRYFAYPLVVIIAFLCRNITELALPALNFQKAVLDFEAIGETYLYVPLTPDELSYYVIILNVTTAISGLAGVFYSKKSPLEFIDWNNTTVFANLWGLSAIIFIAGGIGAIDNHAGIVFSLLLVGFVASYFIVRNFAYISREISIYGEMGAYNTSGIGRIYKYYFSLLALTAIVPVILGIIVIPFLVNVIETLISFVLALFFMALKSMPYSPPDAEIEADITQSATETAAKLTESASPGNGFYNYISLYLAAIALLGFAAVAFLFRKQIKEAIKALFSKLLPPDYDNNKIVNEEIITKAKKEKKSRLSHKGYLKQARKITDGKKRFLFAYNYAFWGLVKKDKKLKLCATPNELAQSYIDLSPPADVYQDIKYGQKPMEDMAGTSKISEMTEQTEDIIQKYL